jgi:hypothetical protein
LVFVEVLLVVAPGPSEEAFPAAAAAEEAFPVGALRVAAAEAAFLVAVRPSVEEEEVGEVLPCRVAGRTSLVLLRGRAPSLMLDACRASAGSFAGAG